MRRLISKIILIVYTLSIILWVSPAAANTTYNPEAVPTVRDGDFAQMGRLVITGTTTLTFTGNNDRAEFRLPPDFYFTSVGIQGQAPDNTGVLLNVVRGFNDPSAVTIRPIAEDSYNPGHYGGVEINVNTASGEGGNTPQLALYFNNVFVPYGWRGAVEVTIEPSQSSGFSSGTYSVATVDAAKLDLKAEKTPSFVADKRVGPILISENMGGAFDYIEFSLPSGFQWNPDSVSIDPGLGLVKDYDGDGTLERDYNISTFNNKYGYWVLRVERQGARSATKGTLRITCGLSVSEENISYGDVNLSVAASADPAQTTLKVGTYNELKSTVTAEQPKDVYSGTNNQDVANITITENAPGALAGDWRTVTLELPPWAKWAEEPSVQIEGAGELGLGLDNGRAFPLGSEGNAVQFYITRSSRFRPAKINIKKAKVNLQVRTEGELKITVKGSAGASGEVAVGKVNPPVTATSVKTPLAVALQNQKAGDIDIKEAAGRVILARELWLDFPPVVNIEKAPVVKIIAGDLRIGECRLIDRPEGQRLIIPVDVSSATASTIQITELYYNISRIAPYGDLEVLVGGPAVYETDQPELLTRNDWAVKVANATLENPADKPPDPPQTQTITFKIGDSSYQVNGQPQQMDVSPMIENGRTVLPLRYAALALGVKEENILWDSSSRMATLIKDNVVIQVKVGEMEIIRSGVPVSIDTPAKIHNGRIMVPLRAVAEAFGADIAWDAASQTVTITYNIK